MTGIKTGGKTMEQLNLDEIIKKNNRKYDISLKNLLSSYDIGYKKLYIYMFLFAEEIRNAYFELFPEHNVKFAFDIYGLAESLNVKILEKDLSDLPKRDFTYSPAIYSYYDLYHGRTIYISEMIGDYSKRASLAITLSCFIVNYVRGIDNGVYTIFAKAPFFSDGFNSLPSSLLATFIMMPMSDVFELFDTHTTQAIRLNNERTSLYSLLGYLGGRFHIADFFTELFFDRVQTLVIILYDYNGEFGINLHKFCEKVKQYKHLFKLSDNPNRNKFN